MFLIYIATDYRSDRHLRCRTRSSIVVAAISQRHRHLSASVTAHGGHFEHSLWCLHGSVC